MLSAARRSCVVSRLPCNLLDKTSTKRIIRQLNISRSQVRGYVNNIGVQCFERNCRTLLPTFIQSFNSEANLSSYSTEFELNSVQYERICNETLDSLTEHFEELIEAAAHLPDADVSYGDGVLTIKFGDPYGTYVINRQTPNKQIWLSSPKSGPKRYDFLNGQWVYKHDGKTLHELLNDEIPAIIRTQACFDQCSFSGKEK